MYLEHEFIKPNSIEYRKYQVNIAESCIQENSLVVLPTGLGKTVIAAIVIAKRLKTNPDGKILFLAPTKPLVNQHKEFLEQHLTVDDEKIIVFTGEISPDERKRVWEDAQIIVSTPQVIQNDIISRRLDLQAFSMVVFDEAHRAVGEYAYVYIAEEYRWRRSDRLMLSITASPGGNIDRIEEVCENLDVRNVEVRTKYDADVRSYVPRMDIEWKRIDLPEEFNKIVRPLQRVLSDKLQFLKKVGVLETASVSRITRRQLLDAQKKIQAAMRSRSKPSRKLFDALSAQSAAIKVYHAIELLQTQGVAAFVKYYNRLKTEASSKGGSKASRTLVKDQRVLDAVVNAKALDVDHPKIEHVVRIVKNQVEKSKESTIIVFTQYRDTVVQLVDELGEIAGVRPVRFVGQSKKQKEKGLTQKEQADVLHKFRRGEYNALVATSVAEEGLDIPSTDLVVFYEPIPSEIRTIQRKGRTARKAPGKVVILIAKNTPDEAYYWSSRRREKQMKKQITSLKSKLSGKSSVSDAFAQRSSSKQQTSLSTFADKKKEEEAGSIDIVIDNREYRSRVVKELARDESVHISPRQLEIGDYVVSSRVGIERKTTQDFVDSLVGGKLFRQVRELRNSYARPVMVLEGEELFTQRNVNHKAIFGSLASIVIDFGIPVMTTRDARDTAHLIHSIANREQRKDKKSVAVRGDKRSMPLRQRQQYILEGLPNVSAVLAKRLLSHFKSIKNIANADVEALCEVPGIGESIAAEIKNTLEARYLEKKEREED